VNEALERASFTVRKITMAESPLRQSRTLPLALPSIGAGGPGMRIELVVIVALSFSVGASLAQTSVLPTPVPAAPSARLGLTGVPRIDARRAQQFEPTLVGLNETSPAASPPTISEASPPRMAADPTRASPSGRDGVADCVGLWDKGTHMTKGEWATTCRRLQGRP
jgi:hypothetical protein